MEGNQSKDVLLEIEMSQHFIDTDLTINFGVKKKISFVTRNLSEWSLYKIKKIFLFYFIYKNNILLFIKILFLFLFYFL